MKKILMMIMVVAGIVANASQEVEKWWILDKTSNNQFVGFKTNEEGSAVLYENGANVIERINKTNSNIKASSYTKTELETMFESIWHFPEFFQMMDEKFELMRVDNSKGMVVLVEKKFSELFKTTNK